MNQIKTVFLLLAVSLILISCRKKSESPDDIRGTWIETTDRADTLVFMTEGMLDLRRGKVIYNGHLLPKAWSGLYTYVIKSDSIRLHWMLSSSSNQPTYPFLMKGNQLHVGDFYQNNPTQTKILIFERLK